jgi:hypothetical protein
MIISLSIFSYWSINSTNLDIHGNGNQSLQHLSHRINENHKVLGHNMPTLEKKLKTLKIN